MTSSAKPAPGARKLLGRVEPRLWTPPLRPLSRRTSLGYECTDFMANIAGEPFDPWQEWVVKHALELMPDGSFRFRIILVVVARQNGKALDADTEILTSRGFVTMADIQEGDEVYHPDGHLVRVTAVSEIMHGHDCYQVTTTDGRTVTADAGHLWTVSDKRRGKSLGPRGTRNRWFETVTLTTREMAEAGISRCKTGSRTTTAAGKRYASQEYRFQLPAQQPLKSPDVPLPIHPYVLGAWLGDGNSQGAAITSADPEIIDEIRKAGQPCEKRGALYAWGLSDGVRRGPGELRSATLSARLRALGVLGNKHVPDAYLTAGTTQREALLQGLMDTDGTIDGVRGQIEFCSTLRPLADAALYLARSLGWRATLKVSRATLYGKDCGPRYRVSFTPKTPDPFCPFRLPRKVARIGSTDGSTDGGKGRGTISIASVEPVESRPVRCIQVDSPDGLFLAGRDLVPTHNSHLKRGVSLWRMFMQPKSRILGVAQEVTLAREQWQMCQDVIHNAPDLEDEWGDVRGSAGDEYFWLQNGSRYKIGAANRRSGRGGSNDEVNIDELREQRNWQAWAALSKTTMARDNSQIWLLSNAGDDESVVLNQLLEVARAGTDPTIFLAEYSGEEDCELDDWNQIRQANPNLGRRISAQAIRTALTTDPPDVFRTEVLCMRVPRLNSAIDAGAWAACADAGGVLDMRRGRTMAGFDIAPDGKHCTLAVAQPTDDGRVRVAVAGAWDDTDAARKELPGLLDKIRPRAVAWYPSGPAAAFASILRKRPGSVELTGGRVCEVCQEFADVVKGRRIIQPGDALLDAHVGGASKLKVTEGWRFTRQGGHVDAAYAAAGAAELVLTTPIARSKIRVLTG